MELEVATKILEAAKEHGLLDGDIQADEKKALAEAEYFLSEASEAIEQGWGAADAAVCEIYELGTGKEVVQPDVNEADDREDIPGGYTTPPEQIEDEPEGNVNIIALPIEPAQTETEYKKLPIPPDIAEAVVTMPGDLTDLTDVQVRRLHSQFNALLARATWVLSQASNELANAEHLFDADYRRALKAVDKIDPYTEKAKIAKVLEAEAMEDEKVQQRDLVVQNAKANVTSLKALRDVYASNVSVASREWTMRQDEYEKGR
jgi:hypothetical protein